MIAVERTPMLYYRWAANAPVSDGSFVTCYAFTRRKAISEAEAAAAEIDAHPTPDTHVYDWGAE